MLLQTIIRVSLNSLMGLICFCNGSLTHSPYADTDAKIVASMSTALVKLLAALIQDAKSDLPKFEYVTDIPTVILNILNTVNQKLFNHNGAGARTISMTQRLFWTRLKSYLSGTGTLAQQEPW